jgi:hypothetical protein
MALHNSPAYRQTVARPAIHFSAVELLKDPEDGLKKFGLDADSVIFHGKKPLGGFFAGGNVNTRRPVSAAVFDGVSD